ncbi:MAG: HDOD domain-containing protein [Gammaproteobacteria bacterium]|nr:HDOD domain-containing protein [Gammaproteobacteria bacterium]
MTAADRKAPESAAGAVEFLLRRMQHSQDFPALSETVRTLNRLSAADERSTEHLAAVIVRDFALTNKILKVVNSAYYLGFAGKVGTISRAIVVLGIKPVRALAASLILFEQFAGDRNADRVKALIGKSMFGALMARELARDAGLVQGEEAFLAAMFHNLGELLVAFYLPEEDQAILAAMADEGISAAQAQRRVLGVDFDHLGIAVGKTWNFPHTITHSMRSLPPREHERATSDEDTLRQLAGLAHELTDCLAAGASLRDTDVSTVLSRYRHCAEPEEERVAEVLRDTRREYRLLADSIATRDGAPDAIKALTGAGTPDTEGADGDDELGVVTLPDDSVDADGSSPFGDPEAVLSEGLQETTAMLAESVGLGQIAQVVLESIYRAFDLRRIALCLRDPVRHCYAGRMGFGDNIDGYLKALRFDERYRHDVFHVALKQQTDVHIADLALAGRGQGIPTWYGTLCPSGALLFLPLIVQNKPVGCIVAEHALADGLQLEKGALRLVRALRNQLALAIQLRR